MLKAVEFLKEKGKVFANGKIAGWTGLVQRRINTGDTNRIRLLLSRL